MNEAIVIDLLDDDSPPLPPPSAKKADIMTISLLDDSMNVFSVSKRDLPQQSPHYFDLVHIHGALEQIVTESMFVTTCEWQYVHAQNYRTPRITFTSRAFPGRSYLFQLEFSELGFPSSAPKIRPLFCMPGREFCLISAHPALTANLWSPSTNLFELFMSILRHLERLTFDSGAAPIMGGSFEEGDTLEQAAAELYEHYQFALKDQGYKALDQLFEKLIPADLCVCLGSVGGSDMMRGYKPGAGTGYSSSHPNQHGGYQNNKAAMKAAAAASSASRESKTEALMDRIQSLLVTGVPLPPSSRPFNCSPTVRNARNWLMQSPLPDLLALLLKECSMEEMYRRPQLVGEIASVALRLELLLSSTTQDQEMQDPVRAAQATELLRTGVYGRIAQCEARNLFEGGGKNGLKWLKELKQRPSGLYSVAFTIAQEEQRSGGSAAPGQQPAATGGRAPTGRVIHVSGLETKHLMYTGAVEKCPRPWLKELAVIEENLPEEVTLFVSEEHPNYCMALLAITSNADCPYYGGCFLFHLCLPARYPQVPPKVLLHTTGEGSVRFNPNLYNCGKVCLSLLGTWPGEPWNPKESNITQVIKSILYLIFVEEPYYNEPGFPRPSNGQPNPASLQYNLSVMLHTERFAIQYHLQQPDSRYGPDIVLQTIKGVYRERWHNEIRPKLLALHENSKSGIAAAHRQQLARGVTDIDKLVPVPAAVQVIDEGQQQGKRGAAETSTQPPAKRQKWLGVF